MSPSPSCHQTTKAEDYKHDNGSGPRAQLAAHPAVAQFLLDNAANMKREGGINALDELLRRVSGEVEMGLRPPCFWICSVSCI